MLSLEAELLGKLYRYQPFVEAKLPRSVTLAYFVALIFSIGTIVVDIFCPNLIKVHGTYKSYLSAITETAERLLKVRQAVNGTQGADDDISTVDSLTVQDTKLFKRLINRLSSQVEEQDLAKSYVDLVRSSPETWESRLKSKCCARWFAGLLYGAALLGAMYLFFIEMPITIWDSSH